MGQCPPIQMSPNQVKFSGPTSAQLDNVYCNVVRGLSITTIHPCKAGQQHLSVECDCLLKFSS